MKMKADVKAEIWLWASAFCYNMEKMVDIMLERGRNKDENQTGRNGTVG